MNELTQKDDWHLTGDVLHEFGQGDPFAAAVRATRMPMVITDPQQADNPIIFCNEAFQNLTGYTRQEIVGRNCRFLQGPDTSREDVDRLRRAIQAEESIDIDLLNYRKDGSTFWNALYLSPVRNADGKVRFFFASQLDVTDRVKAQQYISQQNAIIEREVERRTADLNSALEAKNLLLHEVDHRVKNNLTMIGSMLRLQARQIKDPAIAASLNSMMERLNALASVHRRLYQSDDITTFDAGAFATGLVADVIGASGRHDIAVKTSVVPIVIPSEKASAFGLVLNEMVTNAVKHAYKDGRPGVISVDVKNNNDRAVVSIVDDGPGFDENAIATGSLGRTLMVRLSRQLDATIEWTNLKPGTQVSITFPVERS